MDDLMLPEPWADTLHGWAYTADQMREYAKKAVEAEREACAKLCDDLRVEYEEGKNMAVVCAARIRACR